MSSTMRGKISATFKPVLADTCPTPHALSAHRYAL